MRFSDAVGARVNVRVLLHDLRSGEVRLHDEGHNLVTAAGLDLLAARLRTNSTAFLSHVAVGTGTVPASAGDVALVTEVFRDVFTQINWTTGQVVFRYYLGPNDANGHVITEAGLFNASFGPTLFARRLLTSPINKTIDVASTIEWAIPFSAL